VVKRTGGPAVPRPRDVAAPTQETAGGRTYSGSVAVWCPVGGPATGSGSACHRGRGDGLACRPRAGRGAAPSHVGTGGVGGRAETGPLRGIGPGVGNPNHEVVVAVSRPSGTALVGGASPGVAGSPVAGNRPAK
jgi:hypothetical protein